MRWGRVVVVVAGLALGVAGCGGQQSPGGAGGGSGDELHGRTFLATSVTEGGQPRPLAPGTKVSLWFAEDGRLVANAGCNTMSGPVKLDGGRLDTQGGLAMTGMGCDAPSHAQDEWLSKLLQGGPSWRLDGDQLVVTSGSTELVLLDREVAEPDLPLEGTRWTVETIYANGVASTMADAARSHIVFQNGKVTGSTGCNTFEGPATVAGSTIRFGELIMTRKACPGGVGEVEAAVVAALQGEVPFTIDANELRLNPNGQHGLGLRGEQG